MPAPRVHEASACGAPVVATAVGGVPEMLPDERYGFIVPVGDPAGAGSRLAPRHQKDFGPGLYRGMGALAFMG